MNIRDTQKSGTELYQDFARELNLRSSAIITSLNNVKSNLNYAAQKIEKLLERKRYFRLRKIWPTLRLRKKPVRLAFDVEAGGTYRLDLDYHRSGVPRSRNDALVSVQYLDAGGKPLDCKYDGLSLSKTQGYFSYLTHRKDKPLAFRLALHAPEGARRAVLSFRAWNATRPVILKSRISITDSATGGVLRSMRQSLWYLNNAIGQSLSLPDVARAATPKVFSILDEISELNWQAEFNLQPVARTEEDNLPGAQKASFLFLESAWKGNRAAWEYAFMSPDHRHPNAQALIRTIGNAREKGLPIAFWNKEDPLHYDKFLPIAKLADHVFTTDSERVEAYRRDTEARSITVLPFAANFAICNPVGRFHTSITPETVCFAGSYYAEGHEDRARQMAYMLEPIRDYDGAIYDRFSHLKSERYAFPDAYAAHIRPGVGFAEMVKLYRQFKVFLNVNTITSSPTMMSRRVYELLASGTPVVSAPSRAIEEQFDGIVQVARNAREARDAVGRLLHDDLHWRRTSHLGLREVASRHQYRHRAALMRETILGAENGVAEGPTVSVIMSTKRPVYLDRILENLSRQKGVTFEVVFALSHEWPESCLNQLGTLLVRNPLIRDVKIEICPAEMVLGDKLNLAVDRASGEFIAKMDDDDFYFDNYLSDIILSFDYGDFDIVGKQSHPVYLEADDAIIWKWSDKRHRIAEFVSGPTITGRRRLFENLRFGSLSMGEDTDFLSRVRSAGGTIYSSDEFNFVQFRSKDADHHTWRADNELFRRASVEMGSGATLSEWKV